MSNLISHSFFRRGSFSVIPILLIFHQSHLFAYFEVYPDPFVQHPQKIDFSSAWTNRSQVISLETRRPRFAGATLKLGVKVWTGRRRGSSEQNKGVLNRIEISFSSSGNSAGRSHREQGKLHWSFKAIARRKVERNTCEMTLATSITWRRVLRTRCSWAFCREQRDVA